MLSSILVRQSLQRGWGVVKGVKLVVILLDLYKVVLCQLIREGRDWGTEIPLVDMAMVNASTGWVVIPDVWNLRAVNLGMQLETLCLLPLKDSAGFRVAFLCGIALVALSSLSFGQHLQLHAFHSSFL